MNTFRNIIAILAVFLYSSCNESSFLREKPLDFFSPENSMVTKEHFETSLNYLYYQTRHIFCNIDVGTRMAFYYATDFAFNVTDYYNPRQLNDYVNKMVPTDGVTKTIWKETSRFSALPRSASFSLWNFFRSSVNGRLPTSRIRTAPPLSRAGSMMPALHFAGPNGISITPALIAAIAPRMMSPCPSAQPIL